MSWAKVNSGSFAQAAGLTTYPLPGSPTLNNIGVFGATIDHGSAGVAAVPTGYTRIGAALEDTTNTQSLTWFLRILDGTETAISWTGAWDGAAVCYAEFSGNATTTPLRTEDSTKAAAAGSTTPNANTSNDITPTSGDLLLSLIQDSSGDFPTFTPGTGFTLAVTEPGDTGTAAIAMEYTTATSGAQHGIWSTTQTGRIIMFASAIKPTGGGTPNFQEIDASQGQKG